MFKRITLFFVTAILTMLLVVPVSAADGDSVTVTLSEQNGSGMSGTATLTEQGGKTTVTLNLTGDTSSVEHPAHIHMGTCATLDPKPKYPLSNVVNGQSETTVDATIADLLASPHAINLHKSKDEISVYIACGDIAGGTGGGQVVPNTGGGSNGGTLSLPLATLVGVALVGSGLFLRRRLSA